MTDEHEKGSQRLQLLEGHFVVEKWKECNHIKFAEIFWFNEVL